MILLAVFIALSMLILSCDVIEKEWPPVCQTVFPHLFSLAKKMTSTPSITCDDFSL